MAWPLGPVAPAVTVDGEAVPHPLTEAEDRAAAVWEAANEFERATIVWLATHRDGWTREKARHVREREWGRQRR